MELTLPPLKLPVVFQNRNVTKTFNRQPDARGREADSIGVWHEGNRAWKLFPSSKDNWVRVTTFYHTAGVAGLPMGDPRFQEGSVKQGSGTATQGFALVTRWLEGRDFNYQTPGKSLTVAMGHPSQKISHSRSSTQYKRIYAGCISARKVGLRDIQGYVDGRAGVFEPVAFFDVHTSGTAVQAQRLVDEITAWGTKP